MHLIDEEKNQTASRKFRSARSSRFHASFGPEESLKKMQAKAKARYKIKVKSKSLKLRVGSRLS
jgi:hypothetical protein